MAEGHEVARAVVTIIPSLSGSQKKITKELTEATEPAAEKAGKESGSSFTSKFGGTVKKIGAISATAFAGISAGVIKTTKDAVNAYADYEQLVGGVDTLFKNSSGKVQDYAQKAFKTTGMSANDYMSTVTSFSASLLQSLSGDTDKAAKVADMAMIDMADNANKMGTDMESIQTAYQGFAKQNYTMLDNLKLGYGGTKSEMERLLEDATKFSGIKYDINNLSDVYNAIHVIQNEMGITGTTAKEAMTTISGSAGAAKAAWQNVLVAVAGGGPGLQKAVDDLLYTVFGGPEGGGLLNNLLPVIQTAVNGIGSFISTAAPLIMPKITELVTSLIPGMIEATSSILSAITEQLPTLVESVTQLIPEIISSLTTLIPQLAQSGLEMLKTIIKGIVENLPQLVTAAADIIAALITDISTELPGILASGGDILKKLVEGIVSNAPQLIESASTAISNFISGISGALPDILKVGGEIIGELVKAIGSEESGLPNILNAFSSFGQDIIAALDEHAPGIAQAIRTIMEGFEPFIPAVESMVKTVADKLPEILDSFNNIVSQISPIIDSITGLINQIGDTVVSIVDSVGTNLAKIVDAFSDFNESLATPITAIGDAISGIIASISDGVVKINDSIANILEKLSGVFDSIGNAATKAGDGFATVADAAIRLANQTSVIDLVATLGGIAIGIKDINREAGWMADHDIANKLEKIGPPLKTVTSSAKGLDTAATNIASLAGSIKDLNNEVKDYGTIGTNLDTITEAIGGISTQAATTGEDLAKFVDDAVTDFTSFSTSVGSTLSSMEETFKGKNYNFKYYMKDAIDNINLLNLNPFVETIRNALTTASNLFASVTWRIPHISTPHFYWSGVWDMDGSDGYMSAPSLNVSWYDKGGVFTSPTVIGVAEKRPEFVGALDDLRDIVREESGPHDVTINVYGAEGQDVRTLADIVMERIQHSIDRQEAVFA